MITSNSSIFASTLLALVLVGCSSSSSSDLPDDGDRSADSDGDGIPDSEEKGETDVNSAGLGPQCAVSGRSYPDMEPGNTLEADRAAASLGGERARPKPYSALRSEMRRVLGTEAPLKGDPFGEESANATPPPHVADGQQRTRTWYDEPRPNALTVYSVAAVAFESCGGYVAKRASMRAAPTEESARTECAAMARSFWSKTASAAELEGCVTAATQGAASEPDARKKWAWACTSLISSANFLVY